MKRSRTAPRPSIVDFVTGRELLNLAISPAQETLLRAIYGEPLSTEQLEIWRQCTGRDAYPRTPFGEVVVISGARSGKDSRIAVPVILYEALFGDHVCAKGERPTFPLVAQDARATKVAFGYLKSYLQDSPILQREIAELRASEIELRNGSQILCFPCTASSLRSWSIPSACLDELAYWRLEGQADSDAEIQDIDRRGGLGFANPRIVKISTPYQRSGVLYSDFERHYAKDSCDVLVWKSSTALMNPTITEERLERERRLDPVRFAREYEAEFSSSLQALFDVEALDLVTVRGRRELPPTPSVRYRAAVDVAGGSGSDSFALALGFEVRVDGASGGAEEEYGGWDRNSPDPVIRDLAWQARRQWRRSPRKLVVACLRSWSPPFSPEQTIGEAAQILKSYRVSHVVGDRFSGGFAPKMFGRHGIQYEFSEKPKSDCYLALVAMVNSERIELLDHPESLRQLRALERRTGPSGKDHVDHPRGGRFHDDLANVVALLSFPVAQPVHEWEIIPL